MIPPKEIYAIAKKRFGANPQKCFQRHIREIYSELDPREPIPSLAGATVQQITKAEAESLILRYEWLGTVGSGASAFYGLKIDGELLGAVIFGTGSSNSARNICGEENRTLAVSLMRGCCVHYAPKNAASFLVRYAVKQASIDHGWKIFFAYSDPAAGEVGQIYAAANWRFVGAGLGRPKGAVHIGWIKPDGATISSRSRSLTKEQCLARNYTPIAEQPKGRWVWFEGWNKTERALYRSKCLYRFRSYPKRTSSEVAA
jgi:hypothetical protein